MSDDNNQSNPLQSADTSLDTARSTGGDAGESRASKDKPTFTRSRGGCSACRSAKKKCSQQRPACDRCRAANKQCLYPEPTVWTAATPVAAKIAPAFSNHHASASILESRVSQMPRGPDLSPQTTYPVLVQQDSHTNASLSPQNTFVPTINPYQITDQFGVPDDNLGILGGDWSLDGDAFLQALFSASHTQNLTNDPTFPLSNPVQNTLSSGPMSVPIDCDASLWSFFVDSSHWEEEEPGEDEGGLLEYYQRFTSFGVVIQDGPARHFFQDCASRASREKGRALMHAVLCLSAQHLSNKARTESDKAKLNRYRDISAQHRSQALHLLRVAAADRSNVDAEVLPAIMILLVLAAILKGESGVIPSFLERTSTLLENAVNPADSVFIPSVSALHSMYQAFYSLSAQKQIDLKSLFPNRDSRPVWEERCQGVLETVTGMRKEVFMLLLKANELVLEFNTVNQAIERNGTDEELRMMQIELQARGSAMDADLEDDEVWAETHLEGRIHRTKVGHNCCRTAVRLMMLADIRQLPNSHPMIKGLVQTFVDELDQCAPQVEVGLSWPYIIIASHALPDVRPRCSAFISRAQWKGSAMPRLAQAVVEEVWRDRDMGGSTTWRDRILAKGSPIII